MSLKFGLLGIGQCGTNIAEYALTKGFEVLIANTAQIDLDQAKYVPDNCKIYLGGRGAGRDRQIGIDAMIDNVDLILDKCNKQFSNCDAVFVAASGGGGTGSGGLPIGLEILMNTNKYVGAILVLPDDMESPKSKMNTLECFGQLSELNNLGSVFILDNEKAKKLNPELTRRDIYQITNKQIIDLLIELNSLTNKASYVSNFDTGDLLSIIQERGYTLISKTEYLSDNKEGKFEIALKIRESWKHTFQPEFEDGQIMKGAIIGKIQERLSSKVDVNLIFQETGTPYDFNDVYFYPDDLTFNSLRNKNTFYTILSGLAFPEKRLNIMNNNIKNIEDKLINNLNTSQTQRFESENWSSKFNKRTLSINKDNKTHKINLVDKLNKYKSQ